MRFLLILAFLLTPRMGLAQDNTQAETPTSIRAVCRDPNPVKPCVVLPHPVYQPDPEYPKKALKKKLEGDVWMTVIVGTDGSTHDIAVTKSLDPSLDEEAVKSVKTWKFDPATVDGKPVAFKLTISVSFHLMKN